ncbi:MAG TPA: hypothetical protein VGB77_04855 [Abditibacteriaceae bacterium]|jgi:hypothetical protein
MLTVQTEPIAPNEVAHIVDATNAELASEVLEAALRRDLYIETDDVNARRVSILFITEAQLDDVLIEARNNWLTSLKGAA